MEDKNCFEKHHQKGTLVSKNHIVSLTLVLCLFALLFAAPVKGQNTPLIEESEPMLALDFSEENSTNQSSTASSSSQPYIAGYMTTDYIENGPERGPNAKALRVTVSFIGTDKFVIQSDDFLMAGITAQGPDSVYGGCAAIDWGYTFSLVLAGWESEPYIYAEVVKIHEWGDDCIPPWWGESVSSWNAFIPSLSIFSYVTLTMEWSEDTLDYYAEVGGTTYLLYSYTPNESASHYFMTGTVGRERFGIPWEGTVKWFQFHGAWSNYNIGQVGWHSHLSNPKFIKTGESSWTDVSFAYSTDGRYAFLDHTTTWGGDRYENVDASYYYKNVHFYPTSDGTTLEPDTLLWKPQSPPPPPNGGGGCPYVSTWNGTDYMLDNNLLAASEASNGSDVVDYYKLQQSLVLDVNGTFRLMLSEFENEHDFFDHVQLITVDHSPDENVAVSPYGEILTYTEPSAPVSAIDDNNRNVKHILGEIDGDYYEGYNGSYITLNFGDELDVSQGAKLVMRADIPPYPLKIYSIHVQSQDESGNWTTLATVIPRVYWATEIIDLSAYLPDPQGNLKVRLYFTDKHKLDYVGLDTTPQATLDIYEGQLISAIHASIGDVTTTLLYSDETYAELVPEQQIELKFTLPQQIMEARDYIIILEGQYYTINT